MATIPSSGKDRDWVACLRRVMASAWWGHDVSSIEQPPNVLNGEYLTSVNAAGTGVIPLIGADSSNNVLVNGQTITPVYKTVIYSSRTVGTASGRRFWVADGSYTVVGIQEIHSTAEVTAVTMTAGIQKLSTAGVSQQLLSTSFNLKATANTLQTGTLISNPSVVAIVQGDVLVWSTSAVGTELAGVVAEVLLIPGGRNNQAAFYSATVGAVDSTFFVANRAMQITRIDYYHGTPASGVCTVQVTLDTGTTAPGAGTSILSDNAGSGFNCQSSTVPQTGTLVAAARMNPTDRLAVNFTGTNTGLTNVVVVVTFAPADDRKDVTYQAQVNAAHVDGSFFIADRGYQIVAASAVWSTAGGAASNAQLTIDNGTQVPGGGLDLLSMDTNAGFQIDGTANTVEVATFKPGSTFMVAGDRLSIDFTATATIVGFVCTVTLQAA